MKQRPAPRQQSFRPDQGARDLAAILISILHPLIEKNPKINSLIKEDFPTDAPLILDAPARVAERIPIEVKAAKKENFLAFYLNSRNQLISSETVSIGTLSASLVHPREVFAPAIEHSSAALIVAHNHPSGDCSPSPEDRATTKRLKESGELLGIPLLDHLIVSPQGFFSFRENGLLS